jgi:hypothetical protein
VHAKVELRRGERLAFLRRVKAPRRVRPGRTVRVRVTVQRIRGGRITRSYRVRIPGGLRPGVRTLTLSGFEEDSPDEDLLEILLGEDFGDGEDDDGPASLEDLIASIRALGRWDGVQLRLAGRRRRAFRDGDLLITGRARTQVRIVRR